jgi:hypothetical protein
MKRISLSACTLLLLFGACSGSSGDSPDTATPVTKLDTGIPSPAVDTGAGADTPTIQKYDAGLSDTLTSTVDTSVGADTPIIQKYDAGLSDVVTPGVDVSPTLAETGGTALDAGKDLGIAPQADALDAAKDTAIDTRLAVDSGTSPTDVATTTCGASGQACCAAPANSCNADLACLAGASCSCAKGIFGSYIIRADGVVLQMPTKATGAQTPVLDASTAQPLTGVVSGYDGGGVGCGVRNDGTVWCWRAAASGNSAGQLGNGTTDTDGATFRATQVLTSANTPLTNAKAIDLGYSCVLTKDDNIYCWGDLTWLVNNGTSLISGYAQPIAKDGATPLAGVQGVSVGDGIACAVVQNASLNEVWCWGYNGDKNLGTGDATNRKYPTKILGLTNPSQVVVTYSQDLSYNLSAICALDNGNVLCWGPNYGGQDGVAAATNPVTVPTLVKLQDGVTALSGATRLYAGQTRVCALHTGNTLWCWGWAYQNYADNIGLTNVALVGATGGGADFADTPTMTYLTSDGVFHYGTVAISPKCGSLQ